MSTALEIAERLCREAGITCANKCAALSEVIAADERADSHMDPSRRVAISNLDALGDRALSNEATIYLKFREVYLGL